MLAVLAVTVLAVVGALVVLVRGIQVTGSASLTAGDDNLPSASDRAAAVAVAEQFCLRVDGFDGDDPDGYRKSVTALLTTKYKADFEKEFEQIQKLGIQAGQKGQGKVFASGVSDIDRDSATVLVVHDNTITSSAGSGQQHSRWVINLDKVDGDWLVDDFTQIS